MRWSGLTATFLFVSVLSASVTAENWPGWRGPRGDGTSHDENPPLRWDGITGDNVAWKATIPGSGHGSPVVWQDRVFLLSCVQESQERVLFCLDRNSGKVRWQQTVFRAPLETKHALNSFASSTPVTDGKLVYVTFLEVDGSTAPAKNVSRVRPVTPGSVVVAAYDMQGNQKWLARPGGFVSVHGFCSCPVLWKDLIIVNGDHDGDSYMVALKRSNGETVWKQNRQHKTRSYATPIIRDIDGRTQLVFSGSKCIVSLDPADGSCHWEIDGPTEQFVASMVFDGELFFMAAGFPDYHVMGIRPTGLGDVSETHVAWNQTNARCYVPSPVVINDYLLVADDRGTANCFEAKTGNRLWNERLGKHYSASLITAGGLVYFLADDGITKIIRPGEKLAVVAENALGESCFASPALSDGQLFVRSEQSLYCIGQRGATTAK